MRIVHIVSAGQALCGRMPFPPRSWPEGHVWQGRSEFDLREPLGERDRYCAECVAVAAGNAKPGRPPLTPKDMERAYNVVVRPEYWCRAKLFRALRAAQVKGVLREVLDEMEVPRESADQVEAHLKKYWGQP